MTDMPLSSEQNTNAYIRRLLIGLLVLLIAYGLWRVTSVLLTTFFGVFLAVLLHHGTMEASRLTGLRRSWSFAIILVLLALFFCGICWLIGPQLASQLGELTKILPRAIQNLQNSFRSSSIGTALKDILPAGASSGVLMTSLFQKLGNVMSSVIWMITSVVLVIAVAILGAAEAETYRDGIVKLTPHAYKKQLSWILQILSYDLWRWTCGQAISMMVVGYLFFLCFTILSVPAAFALGFIGGLLEFIPMIGPIIAIGLSALVGLTVGIHTSLYVLLFGTLIQQFESNILIPFIQKRTIWIPPVVPSLRSSFLASCLVPWA